MMAATSADSLSRTQALTTTQILSARAEELALSRVWLPKIIYESLPFLYITIGFAAFFGTLYVPEWYWVLPYYCLFACACIHAGLLVWTQRFVARRRIKSEAAANAPD